MSLKAAQDDRISLGIASCQQGSTEGEVLCEHASVAYDAFWNRCDRLFTTPALFQKMFFWTRKIIFSRLFAGTAGAFAAGGASC